jgi:6-phosphogluconolactonase
MKHRVEHCTNLEDIGRKAASHIHLIYQDIMRRKGNFTLVLSGGKTPEVLYRTLASPPYSDQFDWNRVHIFWGDERYVPQEDPESNYGMAYRSLLSKVPIPDSNVYPMPTDTDDVEEAAKSYEHTLREYFSNYGSTSGSPAMPVFDLILLGLGADGHAASLFSGDYLDPNNSKWVMAVTIPPSYPTRERITMSLPALNAAANVVFLVSGEGKRETLEKVLKDEPAGQQPLAAQHVKPVSDIVWFTDIDVGDF